MSYIGERQSHVRITKRTNIAMRVLMHCAANPGRLVTKHETASCCHVSENHLAQIVNQLSQLDFLDTRRGRNGGFTLSRGPDEITVGEVFRQIEGESSPMVCLAGQDENCPLFNACWLKTALRDATEAFFSHLDKITLSQLIDGNAPLQEMLRPLEHLAEQRQACPA